MESKILNKRKRRTEVYPDASEYYKISYQCDVGLKSLLRSVCDFY